VGRSAWTGCASRGGAKTGLSVREHQERTVANYLDLRDRGPFIPVLQGWTLDDYERCIDLYEDAGVDLTTEPLVGIGTVCRRQARPRSPQIVGALSSYGLSLHGFGMKSRGLARVSAQLDQCGQHGLVGERTYV
jgi:hypothetical protein